MIEHNFLSIIYSIRKKSIKNYERKFEKLYYPGYTSFWTRNMLNNKSVIGTVLLKEFLSFKSLARMVPVLINTQSSTK